MTVVSSEKDAENLTLTMVADFAATPEQVWELWEDARKLERWWGSATVLTPSCATTPAGDPWWRPHNNCWINFSRRTEYE